MNSYFLSFQHCCPQFRFECENDLEAFNYASEKFSQLFPVKDMVEVYRIEGDLMHLLFVICHVHNPLKVPFDV